MRLKETEDGVNIARKKIYKYADYTILMAGKKNLLLRLKNSVQKPILCSISENITLMTKIHIAKSWFSWLWKLAIRKTEQKQQINVFKLWCWEIVESKKNQWFISRYNRRKLPEKIFANFPHLFLLQHLKRATEVAQGTEHTFASSNISSVSSWGWLMKTSPIWYGINNESLSSTMMSSQASCRFWSCFWV